MAYNSTVFEVFAIQFKRKPLLSVPRDFFFRFL